MADKYGSFEELARCEPRAAYEISSRNSDSSTVIVAPHGGGIEQGTSELCVAIAGDDLSWYRFDGKLPADNGYLHITSTRFDEPVCLSLVGSARRVLAVHGERSEQELVYIGGLHRVTVDAISSALRDANFIVREHADAAMQGLSPRNICNRGSLGEGVQLELPKGLRRTFFAGLTGSERRQTTGQFDAFCRAVRLGLEMTPV